MKRMIAKWFVNRSIDGEGQVPDRVRRWIERDDELRQFESAARQLADRLKSDAPRWIAIQAGSIGDQADTPRPIVSRERVRSRPARTIAWSLAASGLAAAVILAIVRMPVEEGRLEHQVSGVDGRSTEKSPVDTKAPLDPEWLLAAWKSGRTGFDQLNARSEALSAGIDVANLPRVATILKPGEVAGSIVGRALATLDGGMESERRLLATDVRLGISFFTDRLPNSAARMIGLRNDESPAKTTPAPNGEPDSGRPPI